jgi:hypothetical protein
MTTRTSTPVYVEWIDMPGGTRRVVDGPFEWATFTYDDIRVGKPGFDLETGHDEAYIGGRYRDGGWVRIGDRTSGWGPGGGSAELIEGWYSDVSIITDPEQYD